MERGRDPIQSGRKDIIKNVSENAGKLEKGSTRHGQIFRKFWRSSKKKGQVPDCGTGFGDGWSGLIAACGTPVKEIIFDMQRRSLRIVFAEATADSQSVAEATADSPSGDLEKRQQVSKQKGKSSQGSRKAKEELRDAVDKMERLFQRNEWHSKTMEEWVHPRDETPRSLRRLLSAVITEYQALCKERAKKMKEERLSATIGTKFPSCENKEESLSGEVAAKELFASEVGDKDTEKQGDREEETEASVASKNDNAEGVEVVEEEEAAYGLPFHADVGFVCDLDDPATCNRWPEVESHDGQHESLESYDEKIERFEDRCKPAYPVHVVKAGSTRPERFEKHIGKAVKAHGVMWEVQNAVPVMKSGDWERDRWDAECFWVYNTSYKVKEYDKWYSRNVRCTELLPTLLPKGLVVQEEKMRKVIQNALDLNFKLKALKRVKMRGDFVSDEASETCET